MKYHYDKDNKIVLLDGSGTLILKQGDQGLELNEELLSNKDITFDIRFHHVVTSNNDTSIKTKLRMTKTALKFIWKRGKVKW